MEIDHPQIVVLILIGAAMVIGWMLEMSRNA
jgi:hypothetical protein